MRNKGYNKCDDITKAMRNLNKKSRKFLTYRKLKGICKCANRNIMKIRKYCKTVKYTYIIDSEYFKHVYKADVIELFDSTFSATYLKAWRKVPAKYNIGVILRVGDEEYERVI